MSYTATKRNATGTSASKHLRKENKVPGVIYASGLDPVNIAMDEMDVEQIERDLGTNSVFELDVDGHTYRVFLREISRSALKPVIYNVNLQAIKPGEKIDLNIPVSIVNDDQLANPDGIPSIAMYELDVRMDPAKAPDTIEADVSGMDIGDNIYVKDIKFDGIEDAEIMEDPDEVVASITAPDTEETVEEAEGEEPEVITEKASEE